MHRHLDDAEAGILDLAHHLEANDAGIAFETHAVEDLAAHQAEVAIDVAHPQPEHQLDRMVIQAADDDAVPRIGAPDLVARHHVGLGRQLLPEHFELRRVVLGISVGIGHELLRGCRESRAQGATVPAIARVMDHAHLRIGSRQLVADFGRGILAPVVHHDHFEIRSEPARHLDGLDHEAGDRSPVVVRREEHAQAARLGRAFGMHGRALNHSRFRSCLKDDRPRSSSRREATKRC